MTESIVKIPQVKRDYDFIAFSFKGKHSYEDFHIYRTSDGNRYNENITPTLADKTADVPGGDGLYFFGSEHKQKNFTINFAFCDLKETDIVKIKSWLDGKEMGDLWFAEEPHKVYTAKVTGTPTLKYLPFDEINTDGKIERVYKGEGSVTFTAYWPYAHTPDYIENIDGIKMPGMYYGSYARFSNYDQLKEVLPQSTENIINPYGDLPFYFRAKLLPPDSTSKITIISQKGGDIYQAEGVTNEMEEEDEGIYPIVSTRSEPPEPESPEEPVEPKPDPEPEIENVEFDLSTIHLESASAYTFEYDGECLSPTNSGESGTQALSTIICEMPFDGNVEVTVYQSSENGYDYGMLSKLNKQLSTEHIVDDESVIEYSAKGINGERTVTYEDISAGSLFIIDVKYYKDDSEHKGEDTFKIISIIAKPKTI